MRITDSSRRLPAFTAFLALGSLAALFISFGSPSDPENSIFFGYSLERILLGGGILLPALALLALTWNLMRRPESSLRLWRILTQNGRVGDAALLFFIIVFLASWVILFLPSYRLGGFAGYAQRLYPLIVWLAIAGGAGGAVLFFERKAESNQSISGRGIMLRVGLIVFGLFVLLGVISLASGIGFRHPGDYWYGAGVPILGLQALSSLLAGAVFIFAERKFVDSKKLDAAVFMLVWIATAYFWARSPLNPNYFMPDTADNIIYPYSDGATFDAGAQYALIGQGLFNGASSDRALYSAALAYLHMFFGQDFSSLMTVQAALLAALPAVVYLLGRELHSRALGFSAAILIAARGANAIIASKWIDTASPKMVLTDFPTALGVAVFLLFLLKWLNEPSKLSPLLWTGAAFGLTLMVRSHALALLPVALLFFPFHLRLNWRKLLLAASILLVGLLGATLPWELRNQSRGIPMFYTYYQRIEILLKYRYDIGADTFAPPPLSETAVHGSLRQRALQAEQPWCDSKPCAISNHFMHNLITSAVSLPSSLTLDDVYNTVKSDLPYWQKDWNAGRIGVVGGVMLAFDLALVSLGVGAVWSRRRSLALLPILLFAAYLMTNSIGLTSGGRYVAPVDWIVYLYFMAGGMQLILWFLGAAGFINGENLPQENPVFEPPQRKTLSRALPTLVFILGVGALIPLPEILFEPRYAVRPAEETLTLLEEKGLLEQTGFSRDEFLAFLSQPNAFLHEGRALYPRYYRADEGEPDRSTHFRPLEYQRLVFTLIGPYSANSEGVIIPGDLPPFDFHAGDVIVLGCWNTTYYAPFLDAVAVFVTSDEGYAYTRSPGASLACPLPEPRNP